MRIAGLVAAGALALAAGACRSEGSGGALGTGGRAGEQSGDLDRDRGGNARSSSARVEAPNPGSRSAAGQNANSGTRDQATAGVGGTPGNDIGSTPHGAASNTLGSDRDVNQRTAIGGQGTAAPARGANPAGATRSNVPNRAPPSGAPAEAR